MGVISVDFQQAFDSRELKQTDAAAVNLQISIQKDSRPSEFSRPLTSITLNLNRDLPVDSRRVSLLKLPSVSHKKLSMKLHLSGIPGNLHKWIMNYF